MWTQLVFLDTHYSPADKLISLRLTKFYRMKRSPSRVRCEGDLIGVFTGRENSRMWLSQTTFVYVRVRRISEKVVTYA